MNLNEARELARSRPVFGSVAWLEAKELLALAPLAEQNFRLATSLLKQIDNAAALDEESEALALAPKDNSKLTDFADQEVAGIEEDYGVSEKELRAFVSKPPGLLNLKGLRELAEAFGYSDLSVEFR